MELRQLRYFVKAAETLNFSDAAKALNIAQSTLSQQIKQLEEELDTQLFERTSHNVALTETGASLLPAAMSTLHEAESCIDRMNDLKQMLTGTLNIGVTYSFSPILTETLITFMKQYPRVKLNIFYKPMAELMDMLLRREVDFLLAFRPLEHNEEVESHTLFDNKLSVIVREHHLWAGRDSISIDELWGHDLALPSQGLQARNAFNSLTAKYRPRLNVRIELNEVNILLKLIKQTDLVTILAEATVYNETGVKAIPLNVPENELAGCVHMLRNSYKKQSALRFIALLRESNAVRQRVQGWFE